MDKIRSNYTGTKIAFPSSSKQNNNQYEKKKKKRKGKYLPRLMVSPRVKRERRTEQRVPMGLNMETKTGPLFFMAHPLKLTHAPLTVPPCICIFIHSFFFKCIVMKGFHISI